METKGTKFVRINGKVRFERNNRIECISKYETDIFSPSLTIEDGVGFGNNCHIGCINKIQIGKNTLIGSNVLIIDHAHGNNSNNKKIPITNQKLFSKGPIKIGNNCWIGENVVILPGVTIGNNSIIGAGAIVTKDVPENSVFAGNPAKNLKRESI